ENIQTLSARSFPSSPDLMTLLIVCGPGLRLNVWPQESSTPALSAASTMRSHSSTLSAIGFSEMTCLPACAAMTTCWECMLLGEATQTTSTSGSAQSASTLS